MRTHRTFPALQPWSWRTAALADLVRAERLAAARLEPVTRGREPAALLDLYFTDGERGIAIPLVYVDLAQLELRESDPLVFPHHLLGVIGDAVARGIIERLAGDLERRAFTGGFWREEVLAYGDVAAFERARVRGFFGAAPLAKALPKIAPAVYARRFAGGGKQVVAYGPEAHQFAAFLSGPIACAVLGDDAEARAWYGDFESGTTAQSYDLAIGSGSAPVLAAVTVRSDAAAEGRRVAIAAPLPAEVMISFDAADGPQAAQFSVGTTREPFARPAAPLAFPAAMAASAGRIGVVIRPDGHAAPDADTAEAQALVAHLEREGFSAALLDRVDALDAFEPDLVHLFGVRPGGYARRVAEWATSRRKLLAVHALYESPFAGGYWGAMVAPYCFGYSADDRSVAMYLEMLARRGVEVDGVGAGRPYAPPIAGAADSERVLGLADVVLVNSERELEAVAPLRPDRPTFIVAPLPAAGGPEAPVGALTGTDPFVLVHAPIWPEANQLLLARAAAELGIAMVLAGDVADPGYAERLREFAPDAVRLIGEPTPEETATLYRTASVVADAAWTTRGHGRLVTAAALGAAVVRSEARWVDLPAAACWTVDPADVTSIARGIGEAWDAAIRNEASIQANAGFARERLSTAASAVVAAYAKIAPAV